MTRLLLLSAVLLALTAAPFAQEVEERVERRIIINGEEVELDDDASGVIVLERDGEDGPSEFRLRLENGNEYGGAYRFEGPRGEFEWSGEDGPFQFRMNEVFEALPGLDIAELPVQFGMFGASGELSREIREMEMEARRVAREARGGDADAEARLDELLDELFELRGEARRASAERLRERAQKLMAEAEEAAEAVAEREADRERIIEDRKRQLLGDRRSDW